MRKIDAFFGLVGVVIGGILIAYAYYSNSHHGGPGINEFAYLVLFPPSILLMATEKSTVLGQVVIGKIVVALNGALYTTVSIAGGTILRKRS